MATVLLVDDNVELLSLMTLLFENAGYQVSTAGRGKQALELSRSLTPELAVLDILLPDMTGFQLADELRKQFPKLHLIFMTGVFKGGRHALEAKQKYAAPYFEKPFDAEKLKEAAYKILPPVPKAVMAEDPYFEVEVDVDIDEETVDPIELTGRIQVSDDGKLTAEIRGETLMAKEMAKGQSALLRGTKSTHEPAGSSGEKGVSRKGELKDNLPALINAFYLSKETGELGVQRGKVKKIVFFENGLPVFAASNLAADRFGPFLVRVGKIDSAQLSQAAAAADKGNKRTGDVLVERGWLNPTERMYYVAQQVKAIIYSLFGWEDGNFALSFRERVRAEPIKLDIHPANLIVRGIKKLYQPARLLRLAPLEERFLPAQNPAYLLNEVELEKWEAELLPKIDGTRTVAELIALSKRPERAVLGIISGLASLQILEPLPT
jgi:CheY-like chemotaxis protein